GLQAKLAKYPTMTVVAPPEGELTDQMIELLCLDVDLDCLSRLGARYGADTVFYTQIDKKGAGHELLVRVVDVAAPALVRDERVPVKTVAALPAAIDAQVEAAFGAPPAPVEDPVVTAEPGTMIIQASNP